LLKNKQDIYSEVFSSSANKPRYDDLEEKVEQEEVIKG